MVVEQLLRCSLRNAGGWPRTLDHTVFDRQMPDSTIAEPILKTIRCSGKSSIVLEEAAWVVWPSERRSGVSAAMSSAQFVHFNAPVIAVQTGRWMEYFDEERRRRWSSNLAWPRTNLEMARLPGRADFSTELSTKDDSSEEGSPEEDSLEEDPAD
jgi:hypothetical protein